MMEVAPVLKRVRTRTPLVLHEPITIGQLRSLGAAVKGNLEGMNEISSFSNILRNIFREGSNTKDAYGYWPDLKADLIVT